MRMVVFGRRRWRWWRLALIGLLAVLLAVLWPAVQRGHEDSEVLARSLQGLIVVVDPGHGGRDPGAIGPRGIFEKSIVLPVSLELADFFRKAGATVIVTRTTDRELYDPIAGPAPRGERKRADLIERLRIVTASQAGMLLSIHANAISSSRWRGAQTFFYPSGDPTCELLATDIQESLRRRLDSSRGTESINHQFLLKNVSIAAATVEIGFMSNPQELALLQTTSYQKRVAWAIFAGVVHYCMHVPAMASPGGQ